MASTGRVLLLLVVLVSLASALNFYGGKTTFAYKGRNPDGSFKVTIRKKATYDGCSDLSWNCYSGNCGYISSSRPTSVIDQSRNAPEHNSQWCETESVETRNLYTDQPFQMRAANCCWVSTQYFSSGMDLTLNTLVDLGVRSDTRKPNRSPNTGVLPFIRVPQNCPRAHKLAAFDPDGDRVRCRFGNIRGTECNGCNPPLGFQLDQDTCTLTYQNTSVDAGVAPFELVIEDYARGYINLFYSDGSQSNNYPLLARRKRQSDWSGQSTISPSTLVRGQQRQTRKTTAPTTAAPQSPPYVNTSPLSKLPLQFSVLVDPPVPSCQEGLYLPMFVSPTPQNGEKIPAMVNKELEIRIRAQATYSQIEDLILTGPSDVTKHKTTHDEFVIRWTPTPDDLGDYFPICFAVESATGSALSSYQSSHQPNSYSNPYNPTSQSGIYHSEMRCVIVNVIKEQIQAKVTCRENVMKVEIDKASFYGIQEDHVQLNDPTNTACSLQKYSNSTHIIGIIPLNACGTQIEEDEDYLYFKNDITTVPDENGLITRNNLVEARFFCQYPKTGNVTLGFTAHRKNITVWERGFGTFTYRFEFYRDVKFGTMKDPNSYPLEYDIGERIYMQIDASSSINNTEMFVESCRASPYDNANSHPIYSIIENGCAVDPTVQIYSSYNDKQFRFSMEAFKFIGLYNQVYISCSVMMCEAGNPNSRCSQGCVNSTRPHTYRHKREAVIQSGMHLVSQGPLRLKRAADSRMGGSDILNLNLVFIAGCLLAAVGIICGVVLYKTKTSRVNY